MGRENSRRTGRRRRELMTIEAMREIQQMALAGFFWRAKYSCVINIMKRVYMHTYTNDTLSSIILV